MAGLTTTGLETLTQDEIIDLVSQEIFTEISATADLSTNSADGQLLGILSRQLRALWELAEETYASQQPSSAEGFALTQLAALTGTFRRAETYSTVTLPITLAAGASFDPGDLVAHVASNPDARFENQDAVDNSGGGSPADFDVVFVAQTAGPVVANAGTLSVIAEPVAGWDAIVSGANPSAAALGAYEETDPELRARRVAELASAGSTTLAAILSAVLGVDSVTSAVVFENGTDATVDGIPPHAFEVVVEGGTGADIGAAILEEKALGIQAYGTSTVDVEDTYGNATTIGYTRPTQVDAYVDLTITYDASTYIGDSALADALVTWGSLLGIGTDVNIYELGAEILAQAGVVSLTDLKLDDSGPPVATTTLAIAAREISAWDSANISVTSSPA